MSNASVGALGEAAAEAHLCARGYKTLCKRYRRLRCEIDLVMRDGDTIVFVEVKTRSGDRFGTGLEAITPSKQRNIVKAATCYLMEHASADAACRFDAVEVNLKTGKITHIENAFTA